ncbi:MAG: ribosome silencing factor [Burkholderiales bacterium]|jgi:ribosome-associated protein|nr:ribosome silencing factor [Burkholderiales bacterium]
MSPDKIAKTAVAALEDIKARDIVVFNVTKMTALFDKVIVASGDSNRQVRALANNVCEEVKKGGGRVLSIEGAQTGEWVLVDLGAVIVHVMQPAIRQYYNLEEIWSTAAQRPAARKTAERKAAAPKTAKPKAATRRTAK